jgi:Protein of unknown function (DUF3429)
VNEPRTDTPERIPLLSLVLGFGPAAVILVAGALALLGWPWALVFGQAWAAVILIFLAGVVRGLSFFTAGGPRMSQIAVSMVRFGCGVAALILPPVLALPVLAVGYLSSLLYDPFAARTGAAPRYFARLRPPQMIVALVGLVLLFVAGGR